MSSGSPTEAELLSQMQKFVNIRQTSQAHTDGTVLALLDALEQAAEGTFTPAAIASYTNAARASLAGAISVDGQFLSGWLADMGKFIASAAQPSDTQRLMQDTYQWFIDNSAAVESRQITYNTPSAGGSNVGSPFVSRLTVDENNKNLEAVTTEAKTLIVRQDQTTGARRGEEQWELHGVEPSPDLLNQGASGSGVKATLITRHGGSGSGGSLLTNSSFDETHGTTDSATDKVPGWTATTPGSLEEIPNSTVAVFLREPGRTDATSQSLRFEGSAAISQKLSVAGITLDASTPYFLRVMVYRESSCDGTLTLALGSQTVAVDMTTHTNSQWKELLLAVDQSCWPSVFYEDDLDISLTLASNTTGTLLVDDLIFAEMDLVDGSYYLLRNGNGASGVIAVPSPLDDTFTWTDTNTITNGKINYILFQNGLGYLPSGTGSAITWPDP